MRKPKHSRRAFQNIMGNILEWLSLHYKKIAAAFFWLQLLCLLFFWECRWGLKEEKVQRLFQIKR